jgi:hypothetical protein
VKPETFDDSLGGFEDDAVKRSLSESEGREVHAKVAQGFESLRQGKGLDGEAVMAELTAELDASEHGR